MLLFLLLEWGEKCNLCIYNHYENPLQPSGVDMNKHIHRHTYTHTSINTNTHMHSQITHTAPQITDIASVSSMQFNLPFICAGVFMEFVSLHASWVCGGGPANGQSSLAQICMAYSTRLQLRLLTKLFYATVYVNKLVSGSEASLWTAMLFGDCQECV